MSRGNGTLTIGLRALPWLRFVFYVSFGFSGFELQRVFRKFVDRNMGIWCLRFIIRN